MPFPDLISTTRKLVSLSRSGSISAARNLFDQIPHKDTIAWNAMLTAYSHSSSPLQALSLFPAMRSSAARPDAFSFTALLAASADVPDLTTGTKLHALVLRLGFHSSLPVCNALIDMYGKCCLIANAAQVFKFMDEHNEISWCSLLYGYLNAEQSSNAQNLFDDMPTRNTFAWNIMIAGFARLGQTALSVELFKRMRVLGFDGDAVTMAGIMNACSEGFDGDAVTMAGIMNACSEQPDGFAVHAMIYRLGWDAAVEVSNSIISFYASLGRRDDAAKVFEAMGHHSQVSWNAMIDANMRAGDVCRAIVLFDRAPEKNAISWTSVISGLARNEYGDHALKMFAQMTSVGIWPDEFTFGATLHACAALAAIESGKMVHGWVVCCGFEAYVYVGNGLVNMYAKCGDIDGSSLAFDGIKKRDLVSWNAMLFGFALHGVACRAVEMFDEMLECGVVPDKVTFIGLLMACSHGGLVEKGKGLLELMDSVYGLALDKDHITCIADMLGRAGHLREARELVVSRMGMAGVCEALLSACAVKGDLRTGLELGERLVREEPKNEAGYVMLSNMYCNSGRWREAEELRREMVEEGVKKEPGCSWIEVRDMVAAFVTGTQSLGLTGDVHVMLGWLESEMRHPSSQGYNCRNLN